MSSNEWLRLGPVASSPGTEWAAAAVDCCPLVTQHHLCAQARVGDTLGMFCSTPSQLLSHGRTWQTR